MNRADCIIIGGGASGCYGAITASRMGKSVILMEKNEKIGAKLRITGKGRCNVTNDCDRDTLMRNIPQGSKFLYSAFSVCGPQEIMAFFEELGVPLKVERGNRVFPVSDRAQDICNALQNTLKKCGVTLLTQTEVLSLICNNGCIEGVHTTKGDYFAPSVMIATGGASYTVTGSNGAGYDFAKSVGHSITELKPSLIPLEIAGKECRDMMGLSLKNVTLSLWERGKKKPVFSELGEMLFTHFGLSGPLVLSASAYLKKDFANYHLEIDLKPGLTEEQLDKRIQRDFAENPNKQFSNALGGLLPTKMIPIVIKRTEIPFEEKVHQITKEQRSRLVQVLKHFSLTITGTRPLEEAIITRGGVSLKEVDPSTMESKLCKGLFFSGEVLDLDAFTGGFNLTIAFATAVLAVQNM